VVVARAEAKERLIGGECPSLDEDDLNPYTRRTPFIFEYDADQEAVAGCPVQLQLSTYLYDDDLFLTSDKRFARLLRVIHPVAPMPFADVDYLDPDTDGLATSIDILVRQHDQADPR
jgi:hypothetical protein